MNSIFSSQWEHHSRGETHLQDSCSPSRILGLSCHPYHVSLTLSLKECLSCYCVPRTVAGMEVRAQTHVLQSGAVHRPVNGPRWFSTTRQVVMGRGAWPLRRGGHWSQPHGQVGASKVETGHHIAALSFLSSSPQNLLKSTELRPRGAGSGTVPRLSPSSPQTHSASSSLGPQKHLYHIPCDDSLFARGRKSVSFALDAGQIFVDQVNSSFCFPRRSDRKKTKLTYPCNRRELFPQHVLC